MSEADFTPDEQMLWGIVNQPSTTLYVDEIEENPEHPDYGNETPHHKACVTLQAKGFIEQVETIGNITLWKRVEPDGRN